MVFCGNGVFWLHISSRATFGGEVIQNIKKMRVNCRLLHLKVRRDNLMRTVSSQATFGGEVIKIVVIKV